MDIQSQQGGHGHGHYGGHGHGGRGCQGGCGDQPTMINGVDISNLSHLFMRQEWEALGDGCNIVQQLRECNQSTGHGQGPPGHGRGG